MQDLFKQVDAKASPLRRLFLTLLRFATGVSILEVKATLTRTLNSGRHAIKVWPAEFSKPLRQVSTTAVWVMFAVAVSARFFS